MAAYGDYALGYIGTEVAYSHVGYETRPQGSLMTAQFEQVLISAIKPLLHE
jgi:hypothetical protein